MTSPAPSVKQVMENVRHQYQHLDVAFVAPEYWEALWLTYSRTIQDIVELVRDRFPDQPRIRILEIGAFCGVVATALKQTDPRFDVTAWDLPLFMENQVLAGHFHAKDIHVSAGNLSTLPLDFPDQAFDIVICCEVVEHLNFNPLPVFCEFNRLLAPGGILYIGTPNQANIVKRLLLARGKSIHNSVNALVWQLDPTSSFSIGLHWKEYTAAELIEVFRRTGFHIIKAYYCHTNDHRNPNPLRRLLVRWMYRLFPAFLPSQVVIGFKETSRTIHNLPSH